MSLHKITLNNYNQGSKHLQSHIVEKIPNTVGTMKIMKSYPQHTIVFNILLSSNFVKTCKVDHHRYKLFNLHFVSWYVDLYHGFLLCTV